MGKLFNYVTFAVGLTLILTMFGYGAGTNQIMELIGFSYTDTGFTFSLTSDTFFQFFFQSVTGILALASTGTAIALGIAGRGKVENLILLPFIVTVLALLIETFVSVLTYSSGVYTENGLWITGSLTIIMLPFTVGYILAMAEWFRGTD